jgi:hypothetical protein
MANTKTCSLESKRALAFLEEVLEATWESNLEVAAAVKNHVCWYLEGHVTSEAAAILGRLDAALMMKDAPRASSLARALTAEVLAQG